MALYREGKAAMAADGTVTGTGTKWQSSLSLIRPGATIMFLSSPIQMAVVNKVVSDTEIKAITTNGAVVAPTDYAILLSDSLTVDGLAQDVAETLRYYQSQETAIADAVDSFKDFDFELFKNLANQAKADSEAANVSAANAAESESAAKTSETNSKTSEANAKISENAAKTSEIAAENARDAAVAAKKESEDAAEESKNYVLQASEVGNMFSDEAAGLAATSNGQFFQVPQGSGSFVSFKLFKNNNSIAEEVARVPGSAAITGTIRVFPTLASAQADADAGNIPLGHAAYYLSSDDSALAIEVINNSGTLEQTGRRMPSEKHITDELGVLDEKKLDKYGTSNDSENLILITDSAGNKTWIQASLDDGMPTSQTRDIIKDTVGRLDHDRIDSDGEELLIAILDGEDNPTALSVRKSDGMFTSPVIENIKERTGRTDPGHIDSGGEELLFSLSDGNNNPTALSVRKSDGMFTDAVIKDIKERLDLPSNDEEVSPDFKTYDRALDFQLISSVARGLSRHVAGTALPAKSYTFVNSYGQGNVIKLPTGYNDATPIPLVLILDGVTSDTSDASLPPSIRSAYDVLLSNGIAMAKSRYHGNSYGSPKCMADLLELYQKACEIAPIGAVILYGNSMGGIAAQNCLLTNTIPSVSGLYLVDPTYDLYQRYTNGRQSEINAAYECTPATYAEKTAGYDPALRHWSEYRGLPIHIRASSLDKIVPFSLHGQKLKDYLGGHNDVTLFDTQTAGHNIADRFNGEELMTFIHTKCISGRVNL